MAWLTEQLNSWGITWGEVGLGVVLFVLMFSLSIAEVTFLLVKLPADYFDRHHRQAAAGGGPNLVRVPWVILKNVLGVIHVVIGIILSLPGVPGQGILTILIGVMLLDLPGVRRFERWLVTRPKVWSALQQLRARFGAPPLVMG
jgi:hypothetical protein